MSDTLFDSLRSEKSADIVFDRLAEALRVEHRYHELFELRLMQSRHRLSLPLGEAPPLDDLREPVRTETEEAYMDACREVGQHLLAEGEFRQAWAYLRPIGEKQPVAEELARAKPTDDSLEELVEIALHEGVAPDLGFDLVLRRYGTCNAITLFESVMPTLAIGYQRSAAERLVRHLHTEVLENVLAHIEQREKKKPGQATLAELIEKRVWLFDDENYHIDISHLASIVRFARLLEEAPSSEDASPLWLAVDLAEYGRRLAPALQMAGEEPFVDLYPSHALFFSALLGERVDEALDYFAEQARKIDPQNENTAAEGTAMKGAAAEGTAAIETYLILLARLGRFREALEAWALRVPPEMRLSAYAPTRLWLAQQMGHFDRYLEICRQRGDLLGYAAGLIEAAKRKP